jgi:hypothetical protein
MSNDRIRCVARIAELFGPHAKIFSHGKGFMVGRDMGFCIAGAGVSTPTKSYSALLAALGEYEVRARRSAAASWRAAAFDAAAEGYDVREPAAQLARWIETGGEDGRDEE